MGRGKTSNSGAPSILAALRYRNYRMFFAGQTVSLVGTWMQRVAMFWLVYRLAGGSRAHQAMMLGTQGFLTQLPVFALAPWAGVLVERCDKRRLLALTQAAAMIQALLLSALVLSGVVQMWHVFALGIALGVVHAFDMPVRQSFVISMIERREDLPNAIALNSFIVNLAKICGPSIAAVLIAKTGTGVCFLANGLSFAGVIAAVLAMRVAPHVRPSKPLRLYEEMREGFTYAWRNDRIRPVLLLVMFISIFGFPYTDMLPIFADSTYTAARSFSAC